MEQTLMDSEDLELASKTHKIMLKVMEAAGKSASKLRKLQPGLTACWVTKVSRRMEPGGGVGQPRPATTGDSLGGAP